MAERANSDRVAADMRPANFRAAIQLIRVSIRKKKDAIAAKNQEIGEDWGKIEGHKVNRKAGRIFAMLDKLEQEERVDIIRSLQGLMDVAQWDQENADLVDQAQDNVVHLNIGTAKPSVDDGERDMEDLEQKLAEPADQVPAAAPKSRRKKAGQAEVSPEDRKRQNDAALEVAERARQRVAKLAAETAGTPAPYTGDNSDLAGDQPE